MIPLVDVIKDYKPFVVSYLCHRSCEQLLKSSYRALVLTILLHVQL